MPFVPVSNTVEVTIKCLYDQQLAENTLYFTHDAGAPSTADIADLLATLESWFGTNLLSAASQDVQLFSLHGRDLTTSAGPQADRSSGMTGVLLDPQLPNNDTLAISFRTGVAGRSFRGRNYIIGLTTAQVTRNIVNPDVLSILLAAYEALPTAVSPDWAHVVVSRKSGGLWRTEGVATPVASYVVTDNIVDSQRRRLPGRGR